MLSHISLAELSYKDGTNLQKHGKNIRYIVFMFQKMNESYIHSCSLKYFYGLKKEKHVINATNLVWELMFLLR